MHNTITNTFKINLVNLKCYYLLTLEHFLTCGRYLRQSMYIWQDLGQS